MLKKLMLILSLLGFVLLAALFLLRKEKNSSFFSDPKITLGYYLFFDKNLSVNHSRSCASCHDPKLAFTDGYRSSVSTLGENLLHNAPSILNTSSMLVYDWAHPNVTTLEHQMLRPLVGTTPVELGLHLHETSCYEYLEHDSMYQVWFKAAYPKEPHWNRKRLQECIAAFEKNLRSTNSPYDAYIAGNQHALSDAAKRGMQLFFSTTLKCSSCHGGRLFSNASFTRNPDSVYFNIGLYNVQQRSLYPAYDNGLIQYSKRTEDDGKFKVPSLRNVALTAPYMHDGSIQTLEEVLELYARGGRLIALGPQAGDGRLNQNKHPFLTGFTLSESDKQNLLAFLNSLSDTTYLQQPWAQFPKYFLNRK